MPLHSLVEEVSCDGGLSSFLLQEGVKISKIVACSLEIAPIIRMDVGRKSSSGDEPSETGKESFSGSVRYHFQVYSLCAKEQDKLLLWCAYGCVLFWGTRRHSGSMELAHHLLFSLGSGSAADDTAPTDSTREVSGV